MKDSFGARSMLDVDGNRYEIYRLDAVKEGHASRRSRTPKSPSLRAG
jgi:hypothetical protein